MRSEWNGPNRVVAHRYSIVYDGRSGRILHVHESTVLEGAQIPDAAALDRRALELAGRHSGERIAAVADRLSVLTIDAAAVPHDGPMKVDVGTQSLVAMSARPARKRTAPKAAKPRKAPSAKKTAKKATKRTPR